MAPAGVAILRIAEEVRVDKLSDWTKQAPRGFTWEQGTWSHGPKETKPSYSFDAAPYGVYYIKPSRDSKGQWIAWEVQVNTYQPDAKGRHWRNVGIGLTLTEAVYEALNDRRENAA